MRLSDAQIELYSRQILLREVGGTGQTRLLAARCLGIGGGAALEVALSYLAGAGIGFLDVLPTATSARDVLPLAPLDARNADCTVTRLDAAHPPSLDDYDVALLVYDASLDGMPDVPAHGRPRVGSIVVSATGDGAVQVILMPRDAGCLACCATPDRGRSGAAPADDAARLAAAGALAALACCGWIVGFAPERAARTLLLPAGEAVWRDAAAPARARCGRGCPPLVGPV